MWKRILVYNVYNKNKPAENLRVYFCRLQTLFNLGSLTDALSDVVQLGSSDLTTSNGLNRDDRGGMDRKNLLTTDVVGNTTDGDGLVDAAMLLGNDGALESLGSLTAAFLDADSNTDGVTDVHSRKLGLDILLFKSFDQIHNNFLPSVQTFMPTQL